jgi:aryl-alcohol dehydrogenase-like predicted oxidoreductase
MYQERYWHEREFETVRQFTRLAGDAGIKPVTLAVAWVMNQPAVTAPILGASRAEQLDDSLAAAEIELDQALMVKLDSLTGDYRRGDAER